ncbi:MAG: alanine dehydrogenase [Bacteroidales bacterium]|nr:alanine dehydrogenase [Bacteroidales bacterium]
MPELSVPELTAIPLEKLQESVLGRHQLSISVIKSNTDTDLRVPLTPMGVQVLAAGNMKIMVESGAGRESSYTDRQYSEAGAVVSSSREELMKSDIIIKSSPISLEEAQMARKNQTLISPLGIAHASGEVVQTLMRKKVVALAMEYIQTEKDFYPITHINSEIGGRNAILIGASQLSKQSGGKGVLLGGITGISPASVVIIGTGTAALYAARAAECLGAEVKIFDDSVYKLLNFTQKLGRDIFTSVLQPQVLEKALSSADVVIGAKRINSHPYPIVTQEMVSLMKKGSVIIDLNVETGSCFETSRPTTIQNPTFKEHGVTHYCLPDITSLVPRTASIALSNVIYPLINEIAENSGINQTITFNPLLRSCVYCYSGLLTNNNLGKRLGIESKSIDLYLL